MQYAPFQEKAESFPEIPLEAFEEAVQLILPDGSVYSAAHAVFRTVAYAPGHGWWLWVYRHIPGFGPVSEAVYRWIARRRPFAYEVTRVLFGTRLEPPSYQLVRWLFLRALGLVYLVAFLSFNAQALGLIGSRGILPLEQFLNAVRAQLGPRGYTIFPTVFWLDASDAAIRLVGIAGVVLALALVIGAAQRVVLALLFALYLSLVVGGQVFMAFQWDALLLETGFLAIFFAPSQWLPGVKRESAPSRAILWLLRWLLFRLMFSSGVAKLASGDLTWRSLTALTFHYETQPLPTPLAWYAHQLPVWFHKLSALGMFGIEIVVPFLFFLPRRLRLCGALATVFLQVLILLTGNYTFFNWITIALCLLLLDDAFLRRAVPERWRERLPFPLERAARPVRGSVERYALGVFVAFMLLVSGSQMADRFLSIRPPGPVRAMVNAVGPLRISNGYGLFAVMTIRRPEIIVEGSADGETWVAYEFKYKAGDVQEAPKLVAPHQPRLDWQMWFAALGGVNNNRWFVGFAQRLLEGSPEVLALLEDNPFPEGPPRFVRAMVYDYSFTDFETRHESGTWWGREVLGEYLPAVTLQGN